MSDESTSIRDGCVAPRVSDPDDTMVGTLGPTETEAGASPKGEGDDHDDGPAFEFTFDPTDETEAEAGPRGDDRTYDDGPGLELTSTRPRLRRRRARGKTTTPRLSISGPSPST